jgi:DNA-binding transcriptional regulator of glucitol operon
MKKTHITLFIFFLVFASSAVAQTKIDRFESAVAKFEQEDQEKGYQPEAVLFTGSSSIRMWKTLL